MKTIRFNKYITGFTLYIVLWIILILWNQSLTGPMAAFGLTHLIPISSIWLEYFLILGVIVPLGSLLGTIIGMYGISKLQFVIHRKLIGSKCVYKFDAIEISKKTMKFRTWLFPILMAVNLSLVMQTPEVLDLIIDLGISFSEGDTSVLYSMTCFVVPLLFTTGIGTLFFSSSWAVAAAKIYYSKTTDPSDLLHEKEIRTVGGWYLTILKGYAGIGILISYYTFISNFLVPIMNSMAFNFIIIANLLLWPTFPFVIALSLIPSYLFFTSRVNRVVDSLQQYVKEKGIQKLEEITFK